jgi:hypothetical protein
MRMSNKPDIGDACYCTEAGTSTEYEFSQALPWEPDDDVLVIFGSRSLDSQPASLSQLARATILTLGIRGFPTPDYILSGGAEGADAVAEVVALELGVPMVVFAVGSVSNGTTFRAERAGAGASGEPKRAPPYGTDFQITFQTRHVRWFATRFISSN